jgi:hypothetical protein
MAGIRKQSNRVTTAISYSRTEALTGWAILGFSLYMLSYLRGRIKDRRIEERLVAVEEERRERGRGRGEDEPLAIGNGDEGNAAGVLALRDAPAPGGVLRLGNGDVPPGGGQQQDLSNLGASSSSSNSNSNSASNLEGIGNNPDYGNQSFVSLGRDPATRGNKSPGGRLKGKEDRKPGYGKPDSGGRTRRRSRQTKKRRRPVKRRQTRKLRRNTKRRRM